VTEELHDVEDVSCFVVFNCCPPSSFNCQKKHMFNIWRCVALTADLPSSFGGEKPTESS
jgi:hypothetical protein